MPDLRLFDVMLFDYGTTNRTDFRNGDIKPIVRTVYKEKPGCLTIRPPHLKDTHTLTDWKNPTAPPGLLIIPKEIEAQPDLGKNEAQKTRPRLIITPGISMDDITDEQTRNVLIEDVYKTTTQRAYSEVAPISNNIRASFPGLPAPSNPITLEPFRVPYVSPEWRMRSAGWDGAQLRAHCDPSREFYLNRALKCDVCRVTAEVEARRRAMKEIKQR